ncbi:MAG: lysophospholipid acyltransferase family protein [bacterium]|nr:lysophospholipid acyltransferase family protein [bacterium]
MIRLLRQKVEYLIIRILEWLLRIVPLSFARLIGSGLGSTLNVFRIRKQVMLENLRNAYPELSEREIEKIANGVYRSFGMTFAEFARLPLFTKENLDQYVTFHHWEVMEQAIAEGKGVVAIAGHLGNWEWMGAATALRGAPMAYIVTTQNNPYIEKRMDELRESCGVEIIKRKDAAKGVLRALRNGKVVAILIDQDAHQEGVFVPFFNRLASAPKGAMVFALRTGSPVIYAEGVRKGNHFSITFERISLDGLPTELDDAIKEGMERCTKRLEESIRLYPEQWLWLHRRWKTKPPKLIEENGRVNHRN